jgi:cystathionine beta-lyase/cystathionine gamma-synthase
MTAKVKQAFATRAVHAGERLQRTDLNPVVGPIYTSVGYTFANTSDLDAVLGGEQPGFVYSTRYGNPTVDAFERAVADLEGAEAGHAFASGMAALHVALLAAGARAGESLVASADLYGATHTLLEETFSSLGVATTFVDVLDTAAVRQATELARPVALLVEAISNPLMKAADLERLAGIAHEAGALFIVDNTFCSPYLCNPLAFGADVVVHSATKFIAGHGDVMGGIVVSSKAIRDEMLRLNKLVGSAMGPFEAWLALRGLKTLPLRLERQCQNALAIALWLQHHPKIKRVIYPGLPDHRQADLVKLLTGGKGAGSVISFELRGARREQLFAFMEALKLVQPATSLGDIYSLVLYPAISSHRSLGPEGRQALGIGDDLVRISVGIEDVVDIRNDLEQALGAV